MTPDDVDLTRPYAWSTTRQRWVNTPCGGCPFHVPDASPETTATIQRIDRELAAQEAPAADVEPLAPEETAQLIEAHRLTFHRLRHAARLAYADVARWTVPAHWNPDPDGPADARVFGRPVEFYGADRIACHWTNGTTRTEPTQEPKPMIDSLAMHVLEDRDGLDLPPGAAYVFHYLSRFAYEDEPVREAVRREVRRKVAKHVAVTAVPGTVVPEDDEVGVAEVSPDELDAAWRKHAPMDPLPLANVYALLGYWTPPQEGPRP